MSARPRESGDPGAADRGLGASGPWITACAGTSGCGCGSIRPQSALAHPHGLVLPAPFRLHGHILETAVVIIIVGRSVAIGSVAIGGADDRWTAEAAGSN